MITAYTARALPHARTSSRSSLKMLCQTENGRFLICEYVNLAHGGALEPLSVLSVTRGVTLGVQVWT